MNQKVLYIIGNGFDLRHGLQTQYSDFHEWLKKSSGYSADIERYFVCKDLWSSFESNLASFNVDAFIDESFLPEQREGGCSPTVIQYTDGRKIWGNRIFPYSEDDILNTGRRTNSGLSEWWSSINRGLREWICSVGEELPSVRPMLRLPDDNARYLTFNYTETLEKVYGFGNELILHIHGCSTCDEEKLVFGHGGKVRLPEYMRGEVADMDCTMKQNALDEVELWRKRTDVLIERHEEFWKWVDGVERVVVLGVSFGSVDMPYLQTIASRVANNSRWRYSWFANGEKEEFGGKIKELSIGRNFDVVPINKDWSGI